MNPSELLNISKQLRVGDCVFIHVPVELFKMVASATNSWTNHVGIVVDVSGDEPIIAESKFPLSTKTPFSRFIKRSYQQRFAIRRLKREFSIVEQERIADAATNRLGIWYDTGFDLYSRRQFCSRFVYEVLQEALNIEVGEPQSFSQLLKNNPGAHLGFWKFWYLGFIPWQRITVTPASVMNSEQLLPIYG